MRPFLLIPAAALAACSPQPASNVTQVANAANAIDEKVPDAAPGPVNPPAPGEPGALDNDMTPVSEAPFTPESAQGAANVVQTYYALIEEKKYDQAYRLLEPGSAGRPDDFAMNQSRYSEVHANIGAPGAIDAGAGQRYVTVPVQIYGRGTGIGKPFNLRGSVTLHRTEADGATPEQKQWRIRSFDVKPLGKITTG